MEREWEGAGTTDPSLAELMVSYEQEVRSLGGADIGSLVSTVLDLLREDASFQADLAHRYRAVAVDELQDINRPQYELLRILGSAAETVLCIGDPDQAIYGFRGSDRELFFRFAAETGARSFSLARNYRSTAMIVAAAEGLIAGERSPGIPPLVAARGQGEKVRVVRVADPDEEGRYIGSTIRDLVGGIDSVSVDAARERERSAGQGTYGFSDVAVLYRTRAVRDALLPGLSAAGLPLRTGESTPLVEEEPFRSLYAGLRLLVTPGDRVSQRILEAAARRAGTTRRVEQFLARRDELVKMVGAQGIGAAMDEIASTVLALVRTDPAIDLGIDTLRSAADDHGGNLPGFLAQVSLYARESEGPRAAQKISLLTFHAAKGLEFPVVFLAGAEEGITPRHEDRARELAEERRLFYVAATRARDRLIVTHCARRRQHGEARESSPSRFLQDIPGRCRSDETPRPRARDDQLSLFG